MKMVAVYLLQKKMDIGAMHDFQKRQIFGDDDIIKDEYTLAGSQG